MSGPLAEGDAVQAFKDKFQELTGNTFDNLKAFEAQAGKYSLVQQDYIARAARSVASSSVRPRVDALLHRRVSGPRSCRGPASGRQRAHPIGGPRPGAAGGGGGARGAGGVGAGAPGPGRPAG